MDVMLIVAGALTGLVVGLTGLGGGALMTPLLLLFFGVAPLTAVGTDLWFAAAKTIDYIGRRQSWPVSNSNFGRGGGARCGVPLLSLSAATCTPAIDCDRYCPRHPARGICRAGALGDG